MRYKNLNLAFLMEIIVGFGSIISISILGPKGMAALILIAIRPFILERESIEQDNFYWRFIYRVNYHTLIVTSLFIITYYLVTTLQRTTYLMEDHNLLLQLIPFFLLTHGVVGFVVNQITRRHK